MQCTILGCEDLIIDRLNACTHWKYEVDCEMVDVLIQKYMNDLDWNYLEKQAAKPENNTMEELLALKEKGEM